jgi:hypothetical protein
VPAPRPRALVLLLALGCGRTALYEPRIAPPKACAIEVSTDTLDFGTLMPGEQVELHVTVSNVGTASCDLSNIKVSPGEGFTAAPGTPETAALAPGASLSLGVDFMATGAPFVRTGGLLFVTNEPFKPVGLVSLRARLTHCELTLTPDTLKFDGVEPGASSTLSATATNSGDAKCTITSVQLAGDPGFTTTQGLFELAPGEQHSIPVVFTAEGVPPPKRTGTLTLREPSAENPLVVNLEASINLCVVTASPNPFDFGNVLLNTEVQHTLTFSNTGTGTCFLSAFSLMADPTFSLPMPPGMLTIMPGSSAGVPIHFSAFDSAPPHQRLGTLGFVSNDPSQPMGAVPISAFINTICTEAGQFIYTVDRNGTLSKFDPASLTSTPIGTLDCPGMGLQLPFSMNLDQTATAWVVFDDGSLFTVDVSNAHCTPTSFNGSQTSASGFGMGSVFESSTGVDTLFIAETDVADSLATIDLTSLTVSVVGTLQFARSELSGTGDGQLWAFSPSQGPGSPQVLYRVDRATGATLDQYDVSSITSIGGYAVKFWGGAFYIFIGTDVWKVDRNTLVPGKMVPTTPPQLVLTTPGLDVVGAGVSTCAPVMGM